MHLLPADVSFHKRNLPDSSCRFLYTYRNYTIFLTEFDFTTFLQNTQHRLEITISRKIPLEHDLFGFLVLIKDRNIVPTG